jgi:protein-tyrosine phosphatase/predicted kinase/tetratricopeptide (TPR) repeat protein
MDPTHCLAGNGDCQIVFCRGIVTLSGTAVDEVAESGLSNIDEAWQRARRERDGDHFHVTLLTKADLQRACESLRMNSISDELVANLHATGMEQPDPESTVEVSRCFASLVEQTSIGLSSWVDVGEGRAKDESGEAVFRVVLWPAAAAARRAFGLSPQDFHISLGFRNHDVHGKSKGLVSLTSGAPSLASIGRLTEEAERLMEAGRGSDIDSQNVEALADAALLGATAHDDNDGEAKALRILCQLHGRMKQAERILPCAERLLELDPNDEAGSRSRAFALFMLKHFEDALPAFKHARDQLHKLPQAKREVEEARLQQAETFCQKKVGCKAAQASSSVDSTLFSSDDDFDRAFLVQREMKFPSTAHLKNLGAATRDDKLVDAKRQQVFCGGGRTVCIEEKVDGANLGISLDSQYMPRLQGRSKYVNWETDHQFRGLKDWLEEHSSALCEMLERNRHVLFGEWCAYLHTVSYNRLPGYFIAFDIFDRQAGRFLSRRSFHTRLASTSEPRVPAIPVLDCRAFGSVKEVEELLSRQSRFGPDVLEGVYLRVDEDAVTNSAETFLEDRCKLVRAEFQQAIEESDGGWRGRGRNELDMDMKATYPAESYVFAYQHPAAAAEAAQSSKTSGYIQQNETAAPKENYPKTPHVPFSPGVNDDDVYVSDVTALIAEEVVVTEKLDGGNCCIKEGAVYARTHSQPTKKEHFSPVKELATRLSNSGVNLEGVEIFGENMFAIHSIEYRNLASFFYAFAIRRNGQWLSWDDTVSFCEELDIPTVPVLFRGHFKSQDQMKGCFETWAREPSAVGADVTPEGFVVRRVDSIPGSLFGDNVAKFVRANHIQTDENWGGRWRKARLGTELPRRALRSLGEPLRNKLNNPRDRHTITTPGVGEIELPRNFSFILDDIAVSSTPKNREQILAMASMEVTLVVTLTEETPLPREWFEGTGVRNSFVPVRNYHPPTVQQTDAILMDVAGVIASGKRAMVHCGGGKGRAGTVAACLLLRYGVTSVQDGLAREMNEGLSSSCQMQSDEVLTLLRDARPGSVETERQERFIREYASLLWGRMADAPDIPALVRTVSQARSEHEEETLLSSQLFSQPEATEEAPKQSAKAKREAKEIEKVKKEMAKRAPKYIVCVGLPGSGKSTFSKTLEDTGNWVRANQDDLGRKGCEKRVSETVPQVRQGKIRLVLDRVNSTKEERKEWLDILGTPAPKDIVCLFFDTPTETCKERAAARLDHPTIRAGGGGRIIDDVAKKLQRPSKDEGFSVVEVVRSAEDAAVFLKRIGVDPGPVLAAAGIAECIAEEAEPVAASEHVQVANTIEEDQQNEGPALPAAFLAWLQQALREELDDTDAEAVGAAVEVILADGQLEGQDAAKEVLEDAGAPKAAAALHHYMQKAF